MEHKFDNREFEQFVKQNADQYRMFPSDRVWKGINNTLHTRRRWYGLGLALLLLTTAAVTGIMLTPSGTKQSAAVDAVILLITQDSKEQITDQLPVIAHVKAATKSNVTTVSPDNTQESLFPVSSNEVKVISNNQVSSEFNQTSITANEEKTTDVTLAEPLLSIKSNTTDQIVKNKSKQVDKNLILANQDKIAVLFENITVPESSNVKIAKQAEQPTIAEIKDSYKDANLLTIESVVNSYKYVKARKKISWRLFVTPTITYRELDDNKPFLTAARSTIGASNSYSFADINSQVTHKPDVGIQLGFTAGYPISKNITLTGGLQFNVNKYNIRASASASEVATIALNTSGGGTNTVSAITNYRNVAGYRAAWLHNKYISASVPIGAEIKLSGNRKTIIGVGATVQPTYVLGNRAYLLSTDLKNYAEVPSLTRKWNINTGFEIFAGYKTGKTDWRIGPQVRYQVFSSFDNKYPIKEHLFDFGVKLGLTLK
jgi:hypothetical protein